MSNKARLGIVVVAVVLAGLPLAGKLMHGSAGQPATGSAGTTYNLVALDGHPVPYAPMHEGRQAPEVAGGSLTINSDGTFTGGIKFSNPNIVAGGGGKGGKGGKEQPGTYTKEGNDLKLKWPGAGYTKATIDGDKLTMNNEGMLFVYQK
jgi:hypothetical protein